MKFFSKTNRIRVFAAGSAIFFAVSFAVITVTPVFAQTTTNTNCTAQTAQSGYLPNPLCVGSISDILYLAVDIATYIGVVLAVVFLIYAGFKYISARGNPEKITEAHHFLLAVVIGIAILIGASAIVSVIENTLTSAGVVNSSVFNTPTQSTTNTSVTNTAPAPASASAGTVSVTPGNSTTVAPVQPLGGSASASW